MGELRGQSARMRKSGRLKVRFWQLNQRESEIAARIDIKSFGSFEVTSEQSYLILSHLTLERAFEDFRQQDEVSLPHIAQLAFLRQL